LLNFEERYRKENIVVRRSRIIIGAVLVLSLVVSALLGGCTATDNAKLKVVASTSLITQIVERVGGDKVDVVNIIPPSQCPGHFDVKPSDIQKLAEAELFLLHGWQGEMFSEELIASANNADLTVVVLDIPSNPQSNWMVPSVQQEAVDRVTAALSQIDAENGTIYQEAGAEYKSQITAKESEIKAKLSPANLASVNVMCADQQEGFVRCTGLNVVAVFGRPDTLTPQVVKELVDTGKAENVTLIIDNLQSGQDAGAGVAEELGCKRIILSNFPGGFDNTETWEKAIDYNVELILGALAQ
jgi:zinc transport system substrate-binding protein